MAKQRRHTTPDGDGRLTVRGFLVGLFWLFYFLFVYIVTP
jgi:hypothetical protein